MADKNIKYKISTDTSQAEKGFSNIKQQSENLTASLKSVAITIGVAFGASQLISFGKQAIIASAQFEELSSYFTGGNIALEQFRKSTMGAVSDGSLIKLSNYASDMNLSMGNQAIAFGIAKEASEKYSTSVEEGFSKFVLASEGNKKAMKGIGVAQADYKKALDDVMRSSGLRIEQLSLEQAAEVRAEALIKAKGLTLDAINAKAQSNADKIEHMGVVWEKFVINMGKFLISSGVIGLLDRISKGLEGWSIIMGGNKGDGSIAGYDVRKLEYFKSIKDLTNEQLKLEWERIDANELLNKEALKSETSEQRKTGELKIQARMIAEQQNVLQNLDKWKTSSKDGKDPLVMSAEAALAASQKLQAQLDKDLGIYKTYLASLGSMNMISLDETLKNAENYVTTEYNKLSASGKNKIDLEKWIASERLRAQEIYFTTLDKLNAEHEKNTSFNKQLQRLGGLSPKLQTGVINGEGLPEPIIPENYTKLIGEFQNLGNALGTIFGNAGDSFIGKMQEALSIIQAIEAVALAIQMIMAFFAPVGGLIVAPTKIANWVLGGGGLGPSVAPGGLDKRGGTLIINVGDQIVAKVVDNHFVEIYDDKVSKRYIR